jgi:hypothetical protein
MPSKSFVPDARPKVNDPPSSNSASSIGPKEVKMLPGEAANRDFDAIELLACVSFDLSTALRTVLGSLKIAQQTVADLQESIK